MDVNGIRELGFNFIQQNGMVVEKQGNGKYFGGLQDDLVGNQEITKFDKSNV